MVSDLVCNHKIQDGIMTAKRESDLLITSMITDRIGQHQAHLLIDHKDYNFQEAQEIKVLLGNNHVGIQGTRSLTALKIIS